MTTVLLVSRDPMGVIHRGNAVYARTLVAFLRARGMRVVLVIPSCRYLGNKPFERVPLAWDVCDDVLVYGGVYVAGFLIRFQPRIWARAVKIVLGRVLSKLGIIAFTERKLWDVGPTSAAECRAVADAVARVKPQAVIANYFFLADAIAQPAAAGLPRLVIVHDLFHARDANFAAAGAGDVGAHIGRDVELRELAKADALITIQAAEDAAIRAALPGKPTLLMPAGFPLTPTDKAPEPDTILLVGSNMDGNRIGLDWFLAKVWPRLRALRPTATLYIYGDIAGHVAGRAPEGVIPVGRVADLTTTYHRHALCIVPLRVGSGLKLKLVEALCHGRAVVSTDVGAQGVESLAGSAFVLADAPADFADACAALLGDDALRRAQETQALAAAAAHFSPEACCGPVLDYLHGRWAA